jgi:hypothetical protein
MPNEEEIAGDIRPPPDWFVNYFTNKGVIVGNQPRLTSGALAI